MSDRADFVISAMLQEDLITQEQLDACASAGHEKGTSTLDSLIGQGVVTRRQIAIMRAEISECIFLDIKNFHG